MAADTGMDTCPSPEITDSRKRPLDGDSENGDVKRSHFSSAVEPTYHFKVLVPSMVAGAIIGKGGETIAQLQKETGARVKMSKSHDFYPGTTERACLITGSVDGIMVVLDFIMEKIKEKPELVKPFPEGVDAKMPQDRDKQVKILVPNSTAGMIIGKGGNYIKQIKEQSGSYVQISQKAKELSLQERCITVVGEKENNKKACLMILQKVVDDPQSGSCPNVSYADVAGPVANYNPTGSPYAVPTTESHALVGGGGRGGVCAAQRVRSGSPVFVAVAGAARDSAPFASHPAYARPHQGGAPAGRLLGGGHLGDRRGAGAAGEARRAGAGAAGRAARAALRRLLPAAAGLARRLRPAGAGAARRRARRLVGTFRGGSIRGASPPSRGAHQRGLPVRRPAAAVQEPHAGRRGRQGLQERRDRRGHRRGHPRPRRAQPGGDPADVGRQHPDLEEGHVRAGHAQPHRHHLGLADRHQQRALPHRAEDPGGGAQAHAPQRHLGPAAVVSSSQAPRLRPVT